MKECNPERLGREDAARYRAIAARPNYIAQDRVDLGFAVKEVCRRMANPTVGDRERIQSLGRYLLGRPRVIAYFARSHSGVD